MMAKKSVAAQGNAVWYSLAAARILLGTIFTWAFVDKLFGLGLVTTLERAWINGGSPTTGFLKNVEGPFADMFNSIAGQPWADWLFMMGLAGIGVALLLGIGIRIAATAGSLLLFFMWMASLPLSNNPVVDDHLVYIALLAAICFGLDQQKVSLARWWQKLPVVRSQPWLW
jgi:thiosulfate dehydrogenase [quinone] large subunit